MLENTVSFLESQFRYETSFACYLFGSEIVAVLVGWSEMGLVLF